jgi:type I restriction-modification system DNA methylase subunit
MACNNVITRDLNYADTLLKASDTFLRDLHTDLTADFVLAIPPSNVSHWSGQRLYGGSWL